MNRQRKIALLGIGIALYVVLSTVVIIPLISRIKLDLGYIVFGVLLGGLGPSATIVGVAGCIISNLLKGGSLPIAWAIGQAFIGLSLGYLLPRTKNLYLKLLLSIAAVFIGIAVIKTALEIWMYHWPFYAKFTSNFVAFVADGVALCIGVILAPKIVLLKDR